MATKAEALIVHPAEAAGRLGITVGGLVALIRRYRYQFTELAPGGKPGDRGRNRWGLTEDQFAKILDGQRRDFRPAESDPETPARAPAAGSLSPDGKSRLVRRVKA